MCGLKQVVCYGCFGVDGVTSRRDVWIETGRGNQKISSDAQSHPVGMCGLKLYLLEIKGLGGIVTSRRDVWIETSICMSISSISIPVTSRRDVWIETRSIKKHHTTG